MSDVILSALTRRFGAVAAVDNVSLTVRSGEFVTLLGPSGCGKTTTLRMVAGLEQSSGGTITIGGRVVNDPAQGIHIAPERRRLGMVFQSYAIWPHMSVFDNVAYPLQVRRRPKEEIRTRVAKALDLVEMGAYAERPAPALSGGQQQRVAIARALVFEPDVLLMDEPLSNLDARLRVQTGEEFRALQQRLGITTLYVTHDQDEAMALSDRVVVMGAGRILQSGAPEAIYRRPVTADVAKFFGTPNLMAATVTSAAPQGEGLVALRLKGEGWEAEALGPEGLAAGDKALAMARPEDIRLADDASPALWRGTLSHQTFRGARRSLTLDTAAGPLIADIPSALCPQNGDTLALTVQTGGLWALKA